MTHLIQERDFQKTCKSFHQERSVHQDEVTKEELMQKLEARLVNATWTLRRLPDRERGFLNMRTMLWPEALAEPGSYPAIEMNSFQAKKRVRISAVEIDQMQPTLDLLQLLPDVEDRRLLFWACWHQEGEPQVRLPWAKVRRSLSSTSSRWTMKRRYDGALRWLAALILLQA